VLHPDHVRTATLAKHLFATPGVLQCVVAVMFGVLQQCCCSDVQCVAAVCCRSVVAVLCVCSSVLQCVLQHKHTRAATLMQQLSGQSDIIRDKKLEFCEEHIIRVKSGM